MCFFRRGVGNHQLTLGCFSSGFNREELLRHTLQMWASSVEQSSRPTELFRLQIRL